MYMTLISDINHKDKLDKNNINIKTKYIVNNTILERNTDDSRNDNIENGIRCEKQYFVFDKLLHREKIFDSRIEYTFIFDKKRIKDYKCPNCGMKIELNNMINCCPYCKTYYNIDYVDKSLGGKYHYDLVLINTTYRLITAIIDLIISIILSYFFIKLTSRTFNFVDVSKIFIYGFILALILYYFFYVIDAYIVLLPIKKYKENQNKKQINFWNRTNINKKTFFNNFNFELEKNIYKDDNIVDYDILDFISFNEFKKNNTMFVKVKVILRFVYYKNNKFTSKIVKKEYLMEKIESKTLPLLKGVNVIMCSFCGASVDATKGYCEYCGSKIKYFQEWIMH